ncbi:helix-turn-helix domain-containing protein [Aeromicrobium endophyticum]|uniref:XRE family transcriptional regulator n=1 Tax=Aeromicrobium endophyticum TaxID=2292704 RepID=A0A371PCJ8_9ACTN|nr:helix-turn-helix transcriptional regulator [Aeromicrobium endophyticum]REK73681.1 XRE family transcriptional regulator [Aeromicrobium endophyticum]
MTETNAVGVALKTLREAAGMTLSRVSADAGVSISYLSRAENGQVQPSADWVRVITATIGANLVAARETEPAA